MKDEIALERSGPPRRGRARRIALYGASRGITEGLLGARGFALAALLGPRAFGGWALFRLAMRYATSAGLGINRGLEREISQERHATPATPDTDLSARAAVGFKLAVFAVLSAAALLASFLVSDPVWVVGLRGFAAAVLTSQLVNYALVYTRAVGDLRRFAVIEILNAALHLGFAVPGAMRWGLPGAFGGFVLASACSVLLFAGRVPFRPIWSVERIRELLRVGLPISVALATSSALRTADRLVVAALGGLTMLGYYAFAVAAAGLATSFAWVIRTIVFPDVYGRAKSAGKERAVRDHIDGTLLPFARLYPPLLGAVALLIGPAVTIALPQYSATVEPAKLFIFAGTTLGFVSLGSLGVVAADRQRVLPLFSAAGLLLNLGLSAVALRSGAGLTGVAAAALLSQAVYAAAILGLAAQAAEMTRPAALLRRCFVPLGWSIGAVFVAGGLAPGSGLAELPAAILLYLLLMLPLVPGIRAEVRKARARAGGAGQGTPFHAAVEQGA